MWEVKQCLMVWSSKWCLSYYSNASLADPTLKNNLPGGCKVPLPNNLGYVRGENERDPHLYLPF